MIWNESSMGMLKQLLFDILDISQKIIDIAVQNSNPDLLRREVIVKTNNLTFEQIEDVYKRQKATCHHAYQPQTR